VAIARFRAEKSCVQIEVTAAVAPSFRLRCPVLETDHLIPFCRKCSTDQRHWSDVRLSTCCRTPSLRSSERAFLLLALVADKPPSLPLQAKSCSLYLSGIRRIRLAGTHQLGGFHPGKILPLHALRHL